LRSDCNDNGAPDACDIAVGTSVDCNANDVPDDCEVGTADQDCNENLVPDECDIADVTSSDHNDNGTPDECEPCHIASPPEEEMIGELTSTKGRFLSIMAGDPGRVQAIRVTAVSLPAPFDTWNGQEWYLGEPRKYCEGAGTSHWAHPDEPLTCGAAPDVYPSGRDWFWAAALVCDPSSAHHMDWTSLADYCNTPGHPTYNARPCSSDAGCGGGICGVEGIVHLYHEAIVPSHMATSTGPVDDPAVYDIQVIDSVCSLSSEEAYSAPLTMTQAGYGDINTDVSTCPNRPPDGSVGVVTDVVGALNKFSNISCAMQKARVDVVPCRVDFNIGIPDVVAALGAFQSGDFEDTCGSGQCGPLSLCKGGPDHGLACETDDDCSSDPCGLDPLGSDSVSR
jgi:hypothetical protein